MASSRPQDEDQNTPNPPTSGASWEQFLRDSTILLPRNMFYRKVYKKNKVTLRADSESLDQFWRPTDIRGKLGASPGGLHHLAPQEDVLQDIL